MSRSAARSPAPTPLGRAVDQALRLAIVLSSACSEAPGSGTSPSAHVTTELDVAWSKFATCVIGAPLAEGEKVTDRVTEIDLAIFLSERPMTDEWPQRCAPHLANLATAAPEVEASKLRDAARRFITLGFSNSLGKGSKAKLRFEELFEAARSAGLRHTQSAEVVSPPAPVKPPPKLEPFLNQRSAALTRALVPDDRFLLLGDGRASNCRVGGPQGGANKVVCRDLGDGWSDRLVPISRASGASDLFFDKGGKAGTSLFSGEGKPGPVEPFGEGSWLFEDGTLIDVNPQGKVASLLVKPMDGPGRVVEIDRPKGARLRMVSDTLVTFEEAEGTFSISVSQVTARAEVGAARKLGELPRGELDVRRRVGPGCEALFFLTSPTGYDREPAVLAVSLRAAGGEWTPLVRRDIKYWRLSASISASDGRALRCDPGSATIDHLSASVERVRCTDKECVADSSGALPETLHDGLVLRLGSKLLVIGSRSEATPLAVAGSVVQYRLAKLEELSATADHLLTVGSAHGGTSEAYGQPRGFTHEGRAYVFFGGREPGRRTYGVSFGEDGAPTPLVLAAQ